MLAVILLVVCGLLIVGGIGSVIVAGRHDESLLPGGLAVALGAIGGLVVLVTSTWLTNDVGRAQILVDSVSRSVVGEVTEPTGGPFRKSPFVDAVEFDLRQQEIIYAGAPGSPPEWTAGRTVDGAELTVQVGGAAANIDVTVNYSLRADQIRPVFEEYGSQQAFEVQVVRDQAMSTIRQVPTGFTTNEFRGSRKGEAEAVMTSQIQSRLESRIRGVAVSIQEVRYSDAIEEQLRQVEASRLEVEKAQSAQEKQRIDNATSREKAATDNEIKLANAKAEADANRMLGSSLTPEVLEARRIDALRDAQTVYVPYAPTIVAK